MLERLPTFKKRFFKALTEMFLQNFPLLFLTFMKLLEKFIKTLAAILCREVLQFSLSISSSLNAAERLPICRHLNAKQLQSRYKLSTSFILSVLFSKQQSHQASSFENNVWMKRDRVGNETGFDFNFIFTSGNCSVILQDLPLDKH